MRQKEERAKLIRPLGDARGQILVESLLKGEMCTHELAEDTDIPQSSVSYHMKILCASGLVRRRRDGKWTYYRLCPDGIEDLKIVLIHMIHRCEEYLAMKK